MHRTTIATALALAALVAVPAAAEPRAAGVRVAACSPADHSAVFYARMKRLPGTRWMALRLTLLERTGTAGFTPVRVPGLGLWRMSRPGRGGLGMRQRVRNLTDGAAYRARVEFRWKDSHGRLVRSTRRTSGRCKLGGTPLANLRVRVLSARPTTIPGVHRYGVRVSNVGALLAQDVAVRLSVDGSEVNTRTVADLGPRESTMAYFRGPACEQAVDAAADPDGQIPEGNETDNVHRANCADLGP